MKTCKTCKYWDLYQSVEHLENFPTPYQVGVCLKEVASLVDGRVPRDGARADGREEERTGYGLTGPDFGCIHHEWKE